MAPTKRRSNLLLYLLLNILVSAATTFGVLTVWDATRKPELAASSPPANAGASATRALVTAAPSTAAAAQDTPAPADTLPPPETPIIQIQSVVGVGDIEQEVVQLKRTGEGNLSMAGWKLVGEHNNTFVFPTDPELILYKGGAVQIFTKDGSNTALDIFWNRGEAAWRSGETIKLIDPQGNQRATYTIP